MNALLLPSVAQPQDVAPPARPKLLDQLRHAVRAMHYSLKTEEAYVHWARLGHKDVSTTMIYTHVLNQGGRGVRSPLDGLGELGRPG